MLARFVLALLATGAIAQEAAPTKVNALYLHPLSLIITTGIEELPLYIPVTYEREIAPAASIAIQPTLLLGSIPGDEVLGQKTPDYKFFGITGQVAYRKYLNGQKAEGIYLSPAVFFSHQSATREAYTSTGFFGSSVNVPEETVSANLFGVLGFIGYRGKWQGVTLYTDLGAGYAAGSVEGDGGGVSGTGVALDVNFGLGMPF